MCDPRLLTWLYRQETSTGFQLECHAVRFVSEMRAKLMAFRMNEAFTKLYSDMEAAANYSKLMRIPEQSANSDNSRNVIKIREQSTISANSRTLTISRKQTIFEANNQRKEVTIRNIIFSHEVNEDDDVFAARHDKQFSADLENMSFSSKVLNSSSVVNVEDIAEESDSVKGKCEEHCNDVNYLSNSVLP